MAGSDGQLGVDLLQVVVVQGGEGEALRDVTLMHGKT